VAEAPLPAITVEFELGVGIRFASLIGWVDGKAAALFVGEELIALPEVNKPHTNHQRRYPP
jgi:hypothetical protein